MLVTLPTQYRRKTWHKPFSSAQVNSSPTVLLNVWVEREEEGFGGGGGIVSLSDCIGIIIATEQPLVV